MHKNVKPVTYLGSLYVQKMSEKTASELEGMNREGYTVPPSAQLLPIMQLVCIIFAQLQGVLLSSYHKV